MFEFLKNRKLDELQFGKAESIHFLVKWENKEYNMSTWEDEFFLKANYSKIIDFSIRKAKEFFHQKKIPVSERVKETRLLKEGAIYRDSESCPNSENSRISVEKILENFQKSKNTIIQSPEDAKPHILNFINTLIY